MSYFDVKYQINSFYILFCLSDSDVSKSLRVSRKFKLIFTKELHKILICVLNPEREWRLDLTVSEVSHISSLINTYIKG